MGSITNGAITAYFSISAKNSDGTFTVSATLTNTSSHAIGEPRLSLSLTDSSPWTRIGTSILYAGGSYSGSATLSSGNTSDDTVYIYYKEVPHLVMVELIQLKAM